MSIAPNPTFDEKDAEIRNDRVENRRELDGPQVGDWIELRDGTRVQIAYVWEDRVQPRSVTCGGSVFLCESGRGSFSGGLDPAIPLDRIEKTGEMREAAFWFFHHGFSGAQRGVKTTVEVPVWKVQ